MYKHKNLKKMKTIIRKTAVALLLLTVIMSSFSCDNNDDIQSSPQDGFTVNNTFYATPNVYITIDQYDGNNNGQPDYYNFFFTDGRITDTYGDIGVGYQYAYSTNTTNLVKLKIYEGSSNPGLINTPPAGQTYIASSLSVPGGDAGFSKDSFVSHNLQQGSTVFGIENGYSFTQIPETIGFWYYPGTTAPTITINTINIDSTTPSNSTINVDYTFLDTNGNTITGHYEGLLGVILD